MCVCGGIIKRLIFRLTEHLAYERLRMKATFMPTRPDQSKRKLGKVLLSCEVWVKPSLKQMVYSISQKVTPL